MAVSARKIDLSSMPVLIGNEKTRLSLLATAGIYIGGSNLAVVDQSPVNGYPLDAGRTEWTLERGEFLYALSVNAGTIIYVMTRD